MLAALGCDPKVHDGASRTDAGTDQDVGSNDSGIARADSGRPKPHADAGPPETEPKGPSEDAAVAADAAMGMDAAAQECQLLAPCGDASHACGGGCPTPCTDGYASGCTVPGTCASDNGGCGDPAFIACTESGGTPTCKDIDECASDNGGCGDSTFFTCKNNDGGPPTCADIDECANDNGGCGDPTFFTCKNNDGGPPTCADIDECASDNGGCGDESLFSCTNHVGAPPTCESIDECNSHPSDGGFAPFPAATAASFVRVPFSGRALVADPDRGRIYGLGAADDATYANRLVTFDATTGAALRSMAVDPEPSALAITGDGSTLWVGSSSSSEIRAVDVLAVNPTVTTYALPPEWIGRSMLVIPPAADVMPAMIDLRNGNTSFVGQVTLAPGMALPSPASGYTYTPVAAGPPGRFFSYNDADSGFQFLTIDATAGSFVATEYRRIIYGFGARDLAYDPDGFVYAYSGEAIDVRIPSAPRRAGTFAYSGRYLPTPGSEHVLMVSQETGADLVHAFDTATFSRSGWLRSASSLGSVRSPVALGPDRVAFLATDAAGPALLLSNATPLEPARSRVNATSGAAGSLEFAIAARALVADPKRGVFYAAVGAGAPIYENRVVTIDPELGEIVNSVPVGSDPNTLALSDDASVLWVGLLGSSSVRRLDLGCDRPIPKAESELPYRIDPRRLLPLPGMPASVAVLKYDRHGSPSNGGLTFFDGGVARPGSWAAAAMPIVVGPPGVFFAYDGDSSNHGFYTVLYDDTTSTQIEHRSSFSRSTRDIAYDPDGFIYNTGGEVFDVRDPLQPIAVGHFDGIYDDVVPLSGPSVLAVTNNTLYRLDAPTLSELGSRSTGCRALGFSKDLSYLAPGRVAYLALGPSSSSLVCVVTDPAFIP